MMASSEVLSARVEDGVAVVTLGSPTRIFFDPEMSDALLETMTALAGDEAVRVVVVTGGATGYFVRHYSVAALISMGEKLKSSGQQRSEDAPYNPGSFASAMRLVEEMPKPVIAAISGTAIKSGGSMGRVVPAGTDRRLVGRSTRGAGALRSRSTGFSSRRHNAATTDERLDPVRAAIGLRGNPDRDSAMSWSITPRARLRASGDIPAGRGSNSSGGRAEPGRLLRAHHQVCGLVAGSIGEDLFTAGRLPNAEHDELEARAIASLICRLQRSIDSYITYARDEATTLLLDNRKVVLAIADELLKRKRLTGREIDETIREARRTRIP